MAGEPLVSLVGELVLTYAIHSTLLLLLVVVLTRVVKNQIAQERLWRFGLLGGVLTSTLQATGFSWLNAIVPGPAMVLDLGPLAHPLVLSAPDAPFVSVDARLLVVAVAMWGLIAATAVMVWLAGHLRLTRLLRSRRPVRFHRLKDKLPRLGAGTRVTVSRELHTPVALVSGEICLPESALEDLTTQELSAVIAHEGAHVDRRDPLWHLIAGLACRIFFFQPLNWVAQRRLRALAEFLCDENAVRHTSPLAVASALARVSSWTVKPQVLVLGMATLESLTVRRVKRILAAPSVTPGGRFQGVFALGSFLLLVALWGPVQLGPIGPTVRYTIKALDNAGPFTVTLERGRVLEMTLDGLPVPAEQIVQEGNQVRIESSGGRVPLLLTLTPDGGMRWTSRSPIVSFP